MYKILEKKQLSQDVYYMGEGRKAAASINEYLAKK